MHTKRIARGALWMDKNYPGWEDQIEIEKLDPDSNTTCVLGQVDGYFPDVVDARFPISGFVLNRIPERIELLGLAWPGLWNIMRWTLRHGFMNARETRHQWRAAWALEIRARRDAKQKVFVPLAWTEERAPVGV